MNALLQKSQRKSSVSAQGQNMPGTSQLQSVRKCHTVDMSNMKPMTQMELRMEVGPHVIAVPMHVPLGCTSLHDHSAIGYWFLHFMNCDFIQAVGPARCTSDQKPLCRRSSDQGRKPSRFLASYSCRLSSQQFSFRATAAALNPYIYIIDTQLLTRLAIDQRNHSRHQPQSCKIKPQYTY